jgi:hypothetical protein
MSVSKIRQQSRQQHEEQRNPVDTDVIGEIETRNPNELLDELEVRGLGVEIDPEAQRHQERDRGDPERNGAGIARNLLGRSPAEEQNEQRADERQEGYDGEPGKVCHGLISPPPGTK